MAKHASLYVDVNNSKGQVMDLDVAKKGIDWILSWKQPKILGLRFSHYKPLLGFDLVKQIVIYAEEKVGKERLEFRIGADAHNLTKEVLDFILEYKNSNFSLNVADFIRREKQCRGFKNIIDLKADLLEGVKATGGINPCINLHCSSWDIPYLGDTFNFWVDFGFRNTFVIAVPYEERMSKEFRGTDFKALQKSMRIICDRYVSEMKKGDVRLRVANIDGKLKYFAHKYAFSKNLPYEERAPAFWDFGIGVTWDGNMYFSDMGRGDLEYYGFGNVDRISIDIMEKKKRILETRGEEIREKVNLNCAGCEFNRVCWLPNSNFVLPGMRGDMTNYYKDFCNCARIQLAEVKRVHNLLVKNDTFLDMFYSDSYSYYCPKCDTYTQYSGKCSACGEEQTKLESPKKLRIKEDIKEFD